MRPDHVMIEQKKDDEESQYQDVSLLGEQMMDFSCLDSSREDESNEKDDKNSKNNPKSAGQQLKLPPPSRKPAKTTKIKCKTSSSTKYPSLTEDEQVDLLIDAHTVIVAIATEKDRNSKDSKEEKLKVIVGGKDRNSKDSEEEEVKVTVDEKERHVKDSTLEDLLCGGVLLDDASVLEDYISEDE